LSILADVTGDDAALRKLIAQATINAQVAEMLLDARTNAGLTQAELAELVGTKQPVIARLENADYEGHSLSMLQRIAEALERRLELRMVPVTDAPRGYSASTPRG
jgi:transcriptional regulator with XRE-family HTH domain